MSVSPAAAQQAPAEPLLNNYGVGCPQTGALPDADCIRQGEPNEYQSRIFNNLCPDRDGFINRIVPCISQIVINAADYFIAEIYPPLATTITAFLTLAITLYGVRLASGTVEKVARDTFVVILKFAGVVYFVANLDQVYGWMLGALDGLLVTVSQASIFGSQLQCSFDLPLWKRVDCLLEVLIGIGWKDSGQFLINGLMSFFFYSLFAGSVSLVIGLLGLWMTINLVLGIFKAVQTYLIALLLLSLVIIVGVLFIPLIFLNAVEYFTKWVKMIISLVLQPVIVFAYLNVTLTAFDIVLYSGEHSVYRTFAGDAVDQEGFNINRYIEEKGLLTDKRIGPVKDQLQTPFLTGEQIEQWAGFIKNYLYPPNRKRGLEVDKADPRVSEAGPPLKLIDWEKAEQVRSPPLKAGAVSLLHEMLGAEATAFMVAFMFLMLLEYVPTLATDLAGGISEAPNVGGLASRVPGVDKLQLGASNAMGRVEDSLVGLVTKRR